MVIQNVATKLGQNAECYIKLRWDCKLFTVWLHPADTITTLHDLVKSKHDTDTDSIFCSVYTVYLIVATAETY